MRYRTEAAARSGTIAALTFALLLAGCSSMPRGKSAGGSPLPRKPTSDSPVKVGQPYQVQGQWYYPADDVSYDEVGYSSWYGGAFHGGATANNETFDMTMVGAAHKTLPLPSYVEVTALDTGRTILVRINDRGPFVANRIIDLSKAAAEQLGVRQAGVARVRVRRVFPSEADRAALRNGRELAPRAPATGQMLAALNAKFAQAYSPVARSARPAPVIADNTAAPAIVPVALPASNDTPAPQAAPSGQAWFVQIGAYGDSARANRLASNLGGQVQTVGALYRVRLGPYTEEAKANDALAQAKGQGYQDAKLIRPTATH